MQYIQALRQAGCDVYWMEQYHSSGDSAFDDRALDLFRRRAHAFGLEGKLLLYLHQGEEDRREWLGISESEAEATLRRADLLLNFHYAIHPSLLALARRTALVDIDPGLLQLWIGTHLLDVAPHDVYLTTGETVSDRTACYLASGKPVVVQHTGPSAFLPNGEGMFRFRSMDEAVDALERINAEYAKHSRAARELAETYFDASAVIPQLLGAALA